MLWMAAAVGKLRPDSGGPRGVIAATQPIWILEADNVSAIPGEAIRIEYRKRRQLAGDTAWRALAAQSVRL